MMRYYLHDEADVHGEGLHSVEAGDEGDGEETLRIHLSPQEEVSLQVVEAEVVLTGGGGGRGRGGGGGGGRGRGRGEGRQTHQPIRNTIA